MARTACRVGRSHALVASMAALGVLGAAAGGCGDDGAGAARDAAVGADAGAGDAASPDDAGARDAGPPRRLYIDDARPAHVFVPASYDGVTPLPLVILLHGYGIDGATQDVYWGLSRQVDVDSFFLVIPDGTVDAAGRRFWNATPSCCDFGHVGVDDVAYVRGLVAEMKARFAIDPARVFATGHSNGGFMSHRLACDAADDFAAVASMAGATFLDPSACAPSEPVSVLEIHGDVDTDVPYDGVAGDHPGAVETVDRWATLDACDTSAGPALGDPPLDLDVGLPGAETTIRRWSVGCARATEASLWTIVGAGHVPSLPRSFAPTLVAWLFAHPRR